MINYKQLKSEIKTILSNNIPEKAFIILKNYPYEKIINPLIGLLYESDELLKFRAVEAIGKIAASREKKDIEKTRIIMRRFMWNLNEESGGIGWGTPEAMAETAASSKKIYDEFIKIFISYVDPESGLYLDHEELHPGIAWGIGRLAKKWPETKKYAGYMLKDLIKRTDPRVRGLSVWASGLCKMKELEKDIEKLLDDKNSFILYDDEKLKTITIGEASQKALKLIKEV